MAQIVRNVARNGTLAPCAVNYLDQIPDQALFHSAHRQRHPASIYKLSLKKIADTYCDVAEEYLSETDRNRNHSSSKLNMALLLERQEKYLHALQEHLDELWMVLKALVDPQSAAKTPIFNERYVVENKLPGAKSFQTAIVDYKKSLQIVNKLKHQQGYIRGGAVWSALGVHLGYFLEEPDDNGILGPSIEIHPDQGAFSFARDLTWHLANVYLSSEKLVQALIAALDARGLSIKESMARNEPDWERVARLVAQIPLTIFPKETSKPHASFQYAEDSKTLTVKMPHHFQVKFPMPILSQCTTVVDEYSLSFKPPVF